MRLTKKRGFTLMELTTAAAIIAVTAALSYPKFESHLERTRAAEAVQILESLYNAQTAFYHENNAYTSTLADLDINIPASSNFSAPTVATADPIASIARSNNNYTLRISTTSTITCIPAGTLCGMLGY